MPTSAFTRLNAKLRGFSQVAIQVAQGELNDIQVVSRHPTNIRQVTRQLRESADLLDEVATEAEVSISHRKEHAEAYATMASVASNAATIIGSEGQNIKIIIYSDPAFALEFLTEGNPEVLKETFGRLPAELKSRYIRWLGGKPDEPTKTQELG